MNVTAPSPSGRRAPFPEGGRDWDDLRADMRARSADDIDWRNGRAPLYVFHNDQETYEIGRRAYFEFFSENALGRKRAFHGIQSMERDVLDFGLSLFSAPSSGEGVFTSGGSESILIGMKAARDAWRAEKAERGPGSAMNIVMPDTAHPAFDKASDLLGFEIRRAAVAPDGRADPEAMRPLIDAETIAIVGSAPCFPYGVIDPIDRLSALAGETGKWLHVDACVGGWIAPFFRMNGRGTPDFDFRFEGVRSISADLHKFGFCPKPASTVFFRDAADAERATFVADAWPSGRFETSTLAGTRPGGAVAAAWAVLNHLGTSGYRDAAARLAEMVDLYVEGITAMEGLRMIAQPDLSIIAFTSERDNMFDVATELGTHGWLVGQTRRPPGIHSMMSLFHAPAREAFLADLAASLERVRAGKGRSGAESDVIY
ncbi:aminotransferase class V-fold PLP-dependent enzyme [Aquicoccus sp. SCR17]|nr:aminotransferase class V-fold PLP-dependent enzyme [Carideicomes alvinocaridis]